MLIYHSTVHWQWLCCSFNNTSLIQSEDDPILHYWCQKYSVYVQIWWTDGSPRRQTITHSTWVAWDSNPDWCCSFLWWWFFSLIAPTFPNHGKNLVDDTNLNRIWFNFVHPNSCIGLFLYILFSVKSSCILTAVLLDCSFTVISDN